MLQKVVVEKEYSNGRSSLTLTLYGIMEIDAPTLEEAKEQVNVMMDRGNPNTLQTIDPRIKWESMPDDGRKWEYIDWSFTTSDDMDADEVELD